MDAYDELGEYHQWLGWKKEPPVTGSEKPRKVPYSPVTGGRASTTDPTTWSSIDAALDALAAHPDWSGLGFVFTATDPFVGIDLDRCANPETGELAPWGQAIVERFRSYAEWSPSLTGVHIIVRGLLPLGGNRKGGIEVYDHARYFTMTANPLPGTPQMIRWTQHAIDTLHTELFGGLVVQPRCAPQFRGPVEPDDAALLDRMFAARNGDSIRRLWDGDMSRYADAEHPHGNPSVADFALAGHLLYWTGGERERADRLMRQSGLYREKWTDQRGQQTYGARTLARVGTPMQTRSA